MSEIKFGSLSFLPTIIWVSFKDYHDLRRVPLPVEQEPAEQLSFETAFESQTAIIISIDNHLILYVDLFKRKYENNSFSLN
ncbi:MAG: hypothetical protein ACE5D6_01740 [Candidatus Zixiibacteriota bacterium]